jgi:hypothetical protein
MPADGRWDLTERKVLRGETKFLNNIYMKILSKNP